MAQLGSERVSRLSHATQPIQGGCGCQGVPKKPPAWPVVLAVPTLIFVTTLSSSLRQAQSSVTLFPHVREHLSCKFPTLLPATARIYFPPGLVSTLGFPSPDLPTPSIHPLAARELILNRRLVMSLPSEMLHVAMCFQVFGRNRRVFRTQHLASPLYGITSSPTYSKLWSQNCETVVSHPCTLHVVLALLEKNKTK